MVKLKKYRVHKAICDVCNGNGFVRITDREDQKEVNKNKVATRYMCKEINSI